MYVCVYVCIGRSRLIQFHAPSSTRRILSKMGFKGSQLLPDHEHFEIKMAGHGNGGAAGTALQEPCISKLNDPEI